ncbi:3',5'-cyclic-nucleotide phosphodiesterase [Pleurotus pulmonarius]|nr:3',5'-cyclic-nucleotide phosphodiesterase [Pleurotus pulmonarius]KAF4586667.1 3',5'-cyclic-nucleotide phosphodiesterase [Pleurotus pulmonarius]
MPGLERMPGDFSEGIYGRRRSADLGGLLLATGNPGQGKGWLGYGQDDEYQSTRYAELLSEMFEQTSNAVNENDLDFVPTTITKTTRRRLIDALDDWHFEPHKLPDEEAIACTMILFETLYRIQGMQETIAISLTQISSFVFHLRRIYRLENTYHNFQHALDVLQAVHCYLRSAGAVPPVSILNGDDRIWRPDKTWDSGPIVTSLGPVELFVVYIAAIGHDVGHPGFTNLFMKNARTPLSLVFDDKSALEQLHYQLLLRVMRHHGLGVLFDNTTHGNRAKKLLCETVLATDMGVHDDFMRRMEAMAAGEVGPICNRQTITCQALLKCADISNPSRPYDVSQHWASALAQEWLSQTILEKHYELPCTILPVASRLSEAKGQIFFITKFAKPLLDLTAKAIHEMQRYADQCQDNLNRWQARARDLENAQTPAIYPPHSPKLPRDFSNAFPLTLPTPIWTTYTNPNRSACSSSSSDSKHSDMVPSGPSSPTESVASSFLFSPQSEVSSSNNRPPSSCGSTAPLPYVSDTGAIFRAVSQVAKRKRKLCENRNSWSPNLPFPK